MTRDELVTAVAEATAKVLPLDAVTHRMLAHAAIRVVLAEVLARIEHRQEDLLPRPEQPTARMALFHLHYAIRDIMPLD